MLLSMAGVVVAAGAFAFYRIPRLNDQAPSAALVETSPDSPLEKTIVGTPLSVEVTTLTAPGTLRQDTYLSTLVLGDGVYTLCTTDGTPRRGSSISEAAALIQGAIAGKDTLHFVTTQERGNCLLKQVDGLGYSVNVE